MPERVLILGGSGLLGRALLRHVPPEVAPVHPSETDLPLEHPERIDALLESEAIDRVLLLAAWTAVDACESDPERAYLVNGVLAGRAARCAGRRGLPLLFMSTDYVFDGRSPRPYREYDAAGPLSVYGRSKWYGESAVREACRDFRIVRGSGLYGKGGPDFLTAMVGRLRQGTVHVVDDQVLAPTCVDDLAPALWKVALGDETGTFHLAASGQTSWYEFARAIARGLGIEADRVEPTTSAALARPAPRPAYSVLDGQRARETFGIQLPPWEEGLAREIRSFGNDGDP